MGKVWRRACLERPRGIDRLRGGGDGAFAVVGLVCIDDPIDDGIEGVE